jgi:hypothetical protein
VAGFWMLLKIYIFNSGPDPRNPQNRPGTAAPDPPDIVEQSSEIFDFRSRGGGPVGHPQGVQSKTLILNIKYHPKASHVYRCTTHHSPRPLTRVLHKVWVLGFLTRAPGPREAPGRSPWAIRGPSRCLRGPPGGPRDLRRLTTNNADFWELLKMCFLNSGPDPGNPQNQPGTTTPDLPDNVERSSEIVGFRSRGGGPVGHPEGVQGKTLIFNIRYLPKVSHSNCALGLNKINCF